MKGLALLLGGKAGPKGPALPENETTETGPDDEEAEGGTKSASRASSAGNPTFIACDRAAKALVELVNCCK